MKNVFVKSALALVLAAAIVTGFAVSSYAMSGENIGPALLYTYYDVRSEADSGLGLTDNYFTVTNVATDRWVQAHVRVRTGDHSIELLDFDILLSPTDVFAFDLYEDAGAMVFASCDSKTLQDSGFTLNFDRDGNGTDDCFVLDSTTFPAMLSLVLECDSDVTTTAEALGHVKNGYVEIISEGSIAAVNFYNSGGSKEDCQGPDGLSGSAADDADNVAIAGKLLDHTNSSLDLDNQCPSDVEEPYPSLHGRQYYAEVRNGVVARMGHLNGEILDDYNSALIEHKENFNAEATDGDCAAADSGPCFAYVAAAIGNTVTDGADDLNRCLYTQTITNSNDVANKYGAAATYGPTIADLVFDDQRDGTLATGIGAISDGGLDEVCDNMADAYGTYNGGSFYTTDLKQFAVSHYFATPAPGVYDINTGFAFTFPCQHFVAEANLITLRNIYDNEENTTVTQIDKFLSPGLPTPSSPAPEAGLFTLTGAPFAEGWVRFEISATNGTGTCFEDATETVGQECDFTPQGNTPADPYVPGYTGAVFTLGADHIGGSHFQYSNQNVEMWNR